jgi:small multidrug resistance pump
MDLQSSFLLLLTILFEVSGTTSLKLSQGFTRLLPSILVVVFYGLSFWLFSLSLRKLDVGVAYAIWSGLGTVLITLVGIFWFKEPVTLVKIVSIALIVLGVIGLRLGGAAQ